MAFHHPGRAEGLPPRYPACGRAPPCRRPLPELSRSACGRAIICAAVRRSPVVRPRGPAGRPPCPGGRVPGVRPSAPRFPADGHGWEPESVLSAGSTFTRRSGTAGTGLASPPWRPAPGPRPARRFGHRPGWCAAPLSPGEQEDLEAPVAAAFTAGVEGTHRLTVPAGVSALLGRLRCGMCEPGTGTWFRADVTVEPDGTHAFPCDHDMEPDFGRSTRGERHPGLSLLSPSARTHPGLVVPTARSPTGPPACTSGP